jgi:hypothetical protein
LNCSIQRVSAGEDGSFWIWGSTFFLSCSIRKSFSRWRLLTLH